MTDNKSCQLSMCRTHRQIRNPPSPSKAYPSATQWRRLFLTRTRATTSSLCCRSAGFPPLSSMKGSVCPTPPIAWVSNRREKYKNIEVRRESLNTRRTKKSKIHSKGSTCPRCSFRIARLTSQSSIKILEQLPYTNTRPQSFRLRLHLKSSRSRVQMFRNKVFKA